MRRDKNPKYIAAGAHEYGHAEIASRARYPKARVVSNALGGLSDVAGLGLGALAQRKAGRLGGALVGGAISGASHIPTLIEEHGASKRALKELRASGDLSPDEYKEADQLLGRAYKSYVNRALGSAATSSGMLSGHVGLINAGAGTRMVSHSNSRKLMQQIKGNRDDATRVRRLGKRMGQHRVAQVYGSSPSYVSPHSHVRHIYKDRTKYLRELNRAGVPVRNRDLDYGAITLPYYEKSAAPIKITIPGTANAAKATKGPLAKATTKIKHGVEDAFNFTSDGPYRYLGRYAKNPAFRQEVNSYAKGKAIGAVQAAQTSPYMGAVKQIAEEAVNVLT